MTFRLLLALSFVLPLATPAHAGWNWQTIQQTANAWKQSAQPYVDKAIGDAKELSERALRQTRLGRYKKYVPSCRNTLYGLGAMAVLSVGSVYHYNRPYPVGQFKNVGTQASPILIPQFGPQIIVEERSPTFSIPNSPCLWVHDGHHGFGKVVFTRDRIEYQHENVLVASTEAINPYGHSYGPEFVISVRVFDGDAFELGTIEEINEETTYGHTKVHYRLRDKDGVLLAETTSLEHAENGTPVTHPWLFKWGDSGGSVSRRGMIWNRYVYDNGGKPLEIDGRLLVVLTAFSQRTMGSP